nr:MAG TPA: hypothetical protein [Caudoviricetes sp.]
MERSILFWNVPFSFLSQESLDFHPLTVPGEIFS